LRTRTLLLGDIVDAKLTPVPAPSMSFADSFNPGYASFKSLKQSRPLVVYAGANDGMLHAFLGSNGTEQFAYVPSALINGPSGTPQVNGLAQLGNPNYVHHNYVDATPLAFDVDLNNAGGSSSTTANWHTLLIGGLGKGGKSYYAIDITDPATMTTESAVAGKVKWEFTDSTMGYSYGAPIVVKTIKYGWVVALTSGYNNSDGIGYLYLLNPNDGTLLEKIATPTASSGLTQAAGYVQDFTDFTADAIYAGDLNGHVWRFELTAPSGTAYPAATLLANLTDSSGNAQPVTTAPLIEIYPTTRKRYVLIGTGQLLSTLDATSSETQTFYAIVDGNAGNGTFNAVASPVTRSTLQQVTDVTVGAPSSAMQGWYTDLGTTSNVGWRVTLNPVAYSGVVAFSTLLPQGDACSPGGQSRVYAMNYGSGTSVLTTNSSTSNVAYSSFPNAIADLRFITTVPTNPELVAGTSAGSVTPVPANLGSAIPTRLLNWREIPTVE
jgi:type IV pilus assembly protein PilY1